MKEYWGWLGDSNLSVLILCQLFPGVLGWKEFWNSVQIQYKSSMTDWYCAQMLSHVWLIAIPWTVAFQAPLSIRFPGKNTEMGFHFLLQEIFPTQGSNQSLLHWQADIFFTTEPLGKPLTDIIGYNLGGRISSPNCRLNAGWIAASLLPAPCHTCRAVSWISMYFHVSPVGKERWTKYVCILMPLKVLWDFPDSPVVKTPC